MFGLFNILDQFAGFILHFIPFYFFLKLAFLVWLFHPISLGATTIYNLYILPNMQQYEKHIIAMEQGVADAASAAREKITEKVTGGSAEKTD